MGAGRLEVERGFVPVSLDMVLTCSIHPQTVRPCRSFQIGCHKREWYVDSGLIVERRRRGACRGEGGAKDRKNRRVEEGWEMEAKRRENQNEEGREDERENDGGGGEGRELHGGGDE